MSSVYTSRIPFGPPAIECIVVYCCDGRFVDQIEEFLHQGRKLLDFDRLVIPGGAGRLLDPSPMDKLRFMVHAHGLRRVILFQHDDCGFYNHERGIAGDAQRRQRRRDAQIVAERLLDEFPGLEVDVYDAVLNGDKVSIEPIQVAVI